MSVWKDMAHDAAYRGDDADYMAYRLEEQEREKFEAREEDRRSTDGLDAEGIENMKLERMAEAGQKLAEHWGHPVWSDSWASQVAKALYDAYRSVPDA